MEERAEEGAQRMFLWQDLCRALLILLLLEGEKEKAKGLLGTCSCHSLASTVQAASDDMRSRDGNNQDVALDLAWVACLVPRPSDPNLGV